MAETQGIRLNVEVRGSPASAAGGEAGSSFSGQWPKEWLALDAAVVSISHISSPNGALPGRENHAWLVSSNHKKFIQGEVFLSEGLALDDGQTLLVEVSVIGYGNL